MTGTNVLMKVLACSLMLRISKSVFFLYMGGDMAIYFLYKLVRGDLRYWINLHGFASFLASFLVRMIGKTVCDFTLLVQFR